MAQGHISRLVRSRGFGFILEADRTVEIPFHWTAVTAGTLQQLTEGQGVEFDRQVDPRDESKIRAVNVRLAAKGH